MANIATYDSKEITITVNNQYITGLGEDMVKVSKDEDNFSTAVGAQGDVIQNKTNNPLGTINLTVQATSPQLKLLNDLARTSQRIPVWIKRNGAVKELAGGTQCAIKKAAERSYGSEAEDREFEIQVFDLVVQ